jgi:type IV pilus assembly protein PilA
MRRQKGFTLIELLIVVAIIGIIAAIAIPSLLRARISANESATIGDIRTLITAQAAYHSSNGGWYDSNLRCLNAPSTCIPLYPANAPVFLDSQLARGALLNKSGYSRAFAPAPPAPPDPDTSPTSTAAFVYHATPTVQNQTGVRGFAGDASGVLCYTPDGTLVPSTADFAVDTTGCTILK